MNERKDGQTWTHQDWPANQLVDLKQIIRGFYSDFIFHCLPIRYSVPTLNSILSIRLQIVTHDELSVSQWLPLLEHLLHWLCLLQCWPPAEYDAKQRQKALCLCSCISCQTLRSHCLLLLATRSQENRRAAWNNATKWESFASNSNSPPNGSRQLRSSVV